MVIQRSANSKRQTNKLGLTESNSFPSDMAPQKMSCKNDAKYMYTGKEMSPMGLGYCAEAEMVGKKMMGRDNKEWIVGTKNGVKIWQRAPDAPLVREEPVMKKCEIEPASDNETDSDSDAEEIKPVTEDDEDVKPTDEEVKTPEMPKPVVEEVKPVPAAPKKRGRPAKAKPENNDDVKPEDKEVKPKRKYTRKPKNVEGDNEAKPDDEEVKPKRKYTRKPKNTEEGDNNEEKKERKPRAKTEYNMYISEKLKELREKHKDLKTTEYFKMAIAEWKVYKENKNTVVVA